MIYKMFHLSFKLDLKQSVAILDSRIKLLQTKSVSNHQYSLFPLETVTSKTNFSKY